MHKGWIDTWEEGGREKGAVKGGKRPLGGNGSERLEVLAGSGRPLGAWRIFKYDCTDDSAWRHCNGELGVLTCLDIPRTSSRPRHADCSALSAVFALLAAVRVIQHCIHTGNTPTTPQRRGERGNARLSNTLPLASSRPLVSGRRTIVFSREHGRRPQVQRPLRGHGLGLHHTAHEKQFGEPEAALGLCSTQYQVW
jgi:hypothetical protein